MPLPPNLPEWLKQFSARQFVGYLRSRPWLSGTTAVCLLLLGLIILFQPADETFVTDDEDLENWPSVELGEFTSTPGPLPEIEPHPSPSSVEVPDATSLPAWATVQTIPTEPPHSDDGIQPVHAEPYRRSPEQPAWLTGTIEEIPVQPTGFAPAAARNRARSYYR